MGSERRVARMKAVDDEKRKWRQEEGIAPRGGKESKNEGKARAEKNLTCRRLITYRIPSPSSSHPAKCEPK